MSQQAEAGRQSRRIHAKAPKQASNIRRLGAFA
jgi:hypothetical protein